MRYYRSSLRAKFSTLLVAVGALTTLVTAFANATGSDLTTLKSLNASTGSAPYGSIVRTADGMLWGTTSGGGSLTNALGTVFQFNPATGALTDIESFNKKNKASGSNPFAPLILASDGNFYGVTEFGGAGSVGTVFQVTTGGAYNVIYSFKGTSDGAAPYGGLVEGPDGDLYGTTLFSAASGGSPSGDGTIFKVSKDGNTFQQLHNFTGADGANPQTSLTIASDGNVYGVTRLGGAVSGLETLKNYGVLFRISTTGTNFTVLHDFAGGTDGGGPAGPLLQASNGVLYGTTNSSDLPPYPTNYTPPAAANYGTVFNVTTAGKFTSLASFSAVDDSGINVNGAYPSGSLIQLANGMIYGTVENGGPSADGGVFVFNPSRPAGPTMVYNFTGTTDGAEPVGGLTLGQDGNIYGTTTGGFTSSTDDGTIFEMFGQPTITSISPTGVAAGAGQFQLTVNGYNFNPLSAFVTDSGHALTVNSITSTKIVATVPAAYNATAGSYPIVVGNDPNIPLSAPAMLTVAPAVPIISSLSPSSTIAGSAGFTLLINGSGFVTSNAAVTFAGTAVVVTAASTAQLSATIPASLIANAGTTYVIVNDNNGAAASSPAAFTIKAAPPLQPTITSLNPPSVTAGAPQFTLYVNGTNFTGSKDTVTFNGTVLTNTLDSATQIQAVVPASLVATAGIGQIVETNAGSGLVSNTFTFTIKAPPPTAPTLTSLSPSSAIAGSTTFTLTISGGNFNTKGVTVNFGTNTISVTSIGVNKVTATVPAADITTAEAISVTVDNDNGAGVSNALSFTVSPYVPPTPVHTFATTGLQMISVPYTFAGISPSSLLGTTITLAVWNPLTISYAVSPTPPANAFTLGQGYWVRLSAAASLYKTGEAADPTIPFQVALGAGWNMIGDPFEVTAPIANMTFQIGTASPVTYAQAVSSGLITGALFTFGPSDSAYEVKGPSDSLQPYWGYWIYANQACNVNISATPAG